MNLAIVLDCIRIAALALIATGVIVMAISLAALLDQVSKLEVAAAAAVALLKEDGTGVSQADVDGITTCLKAVTDSLALTPAAPPST